MPNLPNGCNICNISAIVNGVTEKIQHSFVYNNARSEIDTFSSYDI